LRSYQEATITFYRALIETLENGASHFPSPEVALQSLETLLACLESAQTACMIALPLPEQNQPLAQNEMLKVLSHLEVFPKSERQPLVSIILPLEDHRGMGLPAIESWVEHQLVLIARWPA
jgi:hypothetical protein